MQGAPGHAEPGQEAPVDALGAWRSSAKAWWIRRPISVKRRGVCQGKRSHLTVLASPPDVNLCNVKLEGPFGTGGKSEQMVERCTWDVTTNSLCRGLPRKRKTKKRGENEDPPQQPDIFLGQTRRKMLQD